jgi:hypothetical protein
LQTLLAFRQEKPCLLWLKNVADAFKNRTKGAKKMQSLLGELLKGTDAEIWTHEMLVFARMINKNSKSNDGLNILLAAYKGIDQLHYKDMYCPDIAKGLKQDSSSWIGVLQKFMESGNPPKSRYAYNAFYGVLKRLLQRVKKEDINNFEYARLISDLFTRILLISRKASMEDWKLLVKNTSLELISKLVVDVSEMFLDNASIQKLAGDLLTQKELTAQTYAAVARLLETTTEPNELVLNILSAFDQKSDTENMSIYESPGFWYLFRSLIQNAQSQDVQLVLLRYIEVILNRLHRLSSEERCDHSGLKDSIFLIMSCTVSANYRDTKFSIFKHIKRTFSRAVLNADSSVLSFYSRSYVCHHSTTP